jgi:RES domain-containing protein
LRFQGTCYRGHDPKWAFSPLSGEGASKKGGRFNPKGVPTLYLCTALDGVFAEQHGFAYRFLPLTICCYEVDVEDVIDLSTVDGRNAAGVSLDDMRCAWRLDMDEGREPASWRIANRLRKEAPGILIPSFANHARLDLHNLVLWKWGPKLPHRVNVYDPSGRLPHDQLSWPTGKARSASVPSPRFHDSQPGDLAPLRPQPLSQGQRGGSPAAPCPPAPRPCVRRVLANPP